MCESRSTAMPRLREMTEADVADFAPLFREIVAAGETYAYPEGLSDAQIAALWLERPPARTIVAEDEDATLLGSAKMGPNRPGAGRTSARRASWSRPRREGAASGGSSPRR